MNTDLERQLDQLGAGLADRAASDLPAEVHGALARKRRTLWTRRVALAAAVVVVAAGTWVVWHAANALAPLAPANPIAARPPQSAPRSVPDAPATAPQSIASLKGTWLRTGVADPPVSPSPVGDVMRAGDFANPAKLEAASSPER